MSAPRPLCRHGEPEAPTGGRHERRLQGCPIAQSAGLLHADRETAPRKLVSQGKCTRNPSRPCILSRSVHRPCGMSKICPFGATSPCVLSRGPRMRSCSSQFRVPALRNERAVATALQNERLQRDGRASVSRRGATPFDSLQSVGLPLTRGFTWVCARRAKAGRLSMTAGARRARGRPLRARL